MIFTCDSEGSSGETVNFKMIEVDGEWFVFVKLSLTSIQFISVLFHLSSHRISNSFKKQIEGRTLKQIRLSIVVSIPACHAGDPGSIPGDGASFSFFVILCPHLRLLNRSARACDYILWEAFEPCSYCRNPIANLLFEQVAWAKLYALDLACKRKAWTSLQFLSRFNSPQTQI